MYLKLFVLESYAVTSASRAFCLNPYGIELGKKKKKKVSLLLHLCKNMLMSRTKLELTSIVKSMIHVLLTENYAESEDEKSCLSAKNRGAPMYSLLYYLLSSCGVLTGDSIC